MMRGPQYGYTGWLVLAISGAIALAAAVFVPQEAMSNTWRSAFFCYGLTSLAIGGLVSYFRRQALQARAALERGEDVLARWVVDAPACRVFAEAKHESEEGDPTRYNEFTLPKIIAEKGLEVIVGKEAILAGDSIHVMKRRSIPEVTHAAVYGHPGGGIYADMQLYYPGSARTSPRYTMLRFPVAPGALREAEAAMAYYRDGRPGEPDFFHGRGDGTDAEDLSVCIACGHKTHALKSYCPRCGGTLQSRRWSRRYGFVLVLCGLFLSIAMGAALYYLMPLLLHPGETIGGTRFSGTPAQAFMVFAILALVFVFGHTALGYGVFQMATGRRSKWVITVVLGMWFALLAIAGLL